MSISYRIEILKPNGEVETNEFESNYQTECELEKVAKRYNIVEKHTEVIHRLEVEEYPETVNDAPTAKIYSEYDPYTVYDEAPAEVVEETIEAIETIIEEATPVTETSVEAENTPEETAKIYTEDLEEEYRDDRDTRHFDF